MKVLITGAKGQLGQDIIRNLSEENIQFLGADIDDFDITDAVETHNYIKQYRPDTVIHCAAFTAVDAAEEKYDQCHKVNVVGTMNIVDVCKEINSKLVFISTDYVFDGQKNGEYTIHDITNPLSIYGKTKALAEQFVINNLSKYFIIRTSWVFGINGNNFVKTMIRLAEKQGSINVVCDQIGSPTYTRDLSNLIVEMISTERYGIYHATNDEYCSWAEFAKTIMELKGYSTSINEISSDEYPAKAHRPHNSRLSKESLIENKFSLLPTWKNALIRFLNELEYTK
jgi:dTDP-4-dehydrorhamnose reductase